MRVTTSLTIDMSTGEVLHHDWYEYTGPVALCKGDNTAKDAEKSQAAFTNTLQKAFSTQFAGQQKILDFLQGKLEPQISNPTGLDAATKASLNTQVIDNSATTYQNALKGEQASMATKGGATSLPSGVQAQIEGQLGGQQANTESQGLNQVQLEDQQLKQQNEWNSVNALNGVAAQINPLGYAGDANSGASTVGTLSNAYSTSQNSGLFNTFANGFAGSLGKGLATGTSLFAGG